MISTCVLAPLERNYIQQLENFKFQTFPESNSARNLFNLCHSLQHKPEEKTSLWYLKKKKKKKKKKKNI